MNDLKKQDFDHFVFLFHDLKNSLSAVTQLLAGIDEDYSSSLPGESGELIRLAANQINTVYQMLHENLATYKNVSIEHEKISLSDIVEEVSLILNLRNRVALNIADDLPTIHTDHKRIFSVFLNLLDNAAKHSPPPNSSVHIGWKQEQDGVVIEITNNWNSSATFHNEQVRGYGLGLVSVQKMLRELSGWMKILPDGKMCVKVMFLIPCIVFNRST